MGDRTVKVSVMDELPRCGSCQWYVRQPPGLVIKDEQGFCFRLPPQCTTLPNNRGQVGSYTARPTVKARDRACGLYDLRQRVQEEQVTAKGKALEEYEGTDRPE